MQQIPQLSFGTDTAAWALLLVAVALGFGVVIPLVRRIPESLRLSALVKLVALVLCVAVFVMWTHSSLDVQRLPVREHQIARRFSTEPLVPPAPEESARADSVSTVAVQDSSSAGDSTTGSPASESGAQLPEWTKHARQTDGLRTLIVVKGGRFATAEEATLNAKKTAANIVALEFRHLDPKGVGDPHPQHADEIHRSAVTRQFLEVAETNYGQFKGPSYQEWFELELTPELGTRLAAPWRQAAVDSRLRTLAGWGIWTTCVAGLASFALRLDAAWKSRHRAALLIVSTLAAAGGLAFVA